MTYAELLRKHATDATNEGGMWFSGEYMTMLASMAESVEAESAKLRELVLEIWRSCPVSEDDCAKCPHHIEESDEVWCDIPILMSELGVEGTNDGQVAIQGGV